MPHLSRRQVGLDSRLEPEIQVNISTLLPHHRSIVAKPRGVAQYIDSRGGEFLCLPVNDRGLRPVSTSPCHSAEGRFDAGVAGTPRRAFFAECCPPAISTAVPAASKRAGHDFEDGFQTCSRSAASLTKYLGFP